MSRSSTLLKNTAILSVGAICTKVLTFVMVPLFSHWLSAEEYGEFDLLCTYITLLIPLISLSCGEAVFRKMIDATEAEKQKSVVSTCMAIVAVGLFLLVLCTPIIFGCFGVKHCVSFLFLGVAELINNFMTYYARGKRKLKWYTLANILFVVAMSLGVTILVCILKLGLNGIILGYGLGYVVSALFLVFATGIKNDFTIQAIKLSTLKEVVRYSAPLIPNSISWWIANVSDRTIISVVIGSAANGIYALANKIPAICTAFFSVFHLSWQESASDSVSSEDRDVFYNAVYTSTTKTIISICAVVLSLNCAMFSFIFDSKYYSARYHVPILMTAIIFSFVAQFLGGIFIAFQDTKANGTTTVIAAIINIIVNVLFINTLGLYAASLSTLISYLALYVIRIVMLKKTISLRLDKDCILTVLVYVIILIIQYTDSMVLQFLSFIFATAMFCMVNKQIVIRVIGLVNRMIKK